MKKLHARASVQQIGSALSVACSVSKSVLVDLWHIRLGHPSKQRMKQFSSLNSSIPNGCPASCDICHLSKHKRLPFPTSTSVSNSVFDLIHLDIWGPFPVKSIYGHSFFLTIVDDKSRFVWIFPMNQKSEVRVLIADFCQMIETQFSRKVKCIRSDNARELDMDSIFKSKGIVHQNSCVYTPQQNSVVERKHQHLLNVARALRLQANLPLGFWIDCVLHATYLINITPTPLLDNATPYQMLFQKAPRLDHLRVFGCIAFASVLPKPETKFHSRAIKCVFLGYPRNVKGYKLFNIEKREVFISRDVVFSESVFPFQKNDSNKVVFPVSDSNVSEENFQKRVLLKNKFLVRNSGIDESVTRFGFKQASDNAVDTNNSSNAGSSDSLQHPPSITADHCTADHCIDHSVGSSQSEGATKAYDDTPDIPLALSRPTRSRKLPQRFADYQISLPKGRTSPHTVAQGWEYSFLQLRTKEVFNEVLNPE
ncbi:hypothetical protein GQ457_17G021140 [Hibiscus cannabinus]